MVMGTGRLTVRKHMVLELRFAEIAADAVLTGRPGLGRVAERLDGRLWVDEQLLHVRLSTLPPREAIRLREQLASVLVDSPA